MFVRYSKKKIMNSIKSTFLILFIAVFLISCDNEPLTGNFEDESGISSGSSDGTDGNTEIITLLPFNATVDNQEFDYVTLQSYILNGKLWVRGADALPNKVTIGLPTDVVEGTYEITEDNELYEGIYSDASNNILARANSGTIIVLAHDVVAKTISGTFNFRATPSGKITPQYNITEGEFNVNY
jgi:hypothetical protein